LPFSKNTKFAAIVLKFSITAALIYWLLSGIDYHSVSVIFSKVSIVIIFSAIGVHLLAFLLGGIRWWLMLRSTKISISLAKILPSYYLGLFFNNILPTSMGGDVVRLLHLNVRGLDAKALLASIIADRIVGLIMILSMGVVCMFFSSDINLDDNVLVYALVIALGIVSGVALLVSPWLGSSLERWQNRYRNTRVRRGLLEVITLCHSYRSKPGLIFLAAVISLVMQSLIIFAYYMLGHSISVGLTLTTYFVVIPVVFIATSLPISIGGLGIREGVLVGLLIVLQVDKQMAVSLSLLYLAVLWLSTAPGAAVMLMKFTPADKSTQ
jgi:uncharacterized protein (TIRG00374 family)